MIRTLIAAAALLAATCAQAQSPVSVVVPLGFCQFTPTAVTKLSSCAGGIPAGANAIVIRTESQSIRYRDDGTFPTNLIGQIVLTSDPPLWYQDSLSAIVFIQTAVSATVDVTFYKVP